MEDQKFSVSDLQEKVEQAVIEFMKEDPSLLGLKSAHEQAISHRVAYYLEKKFPKSEKLNVDCEYNKRLGHPKRFSYDPVEYKKREYKGCPCKGCEKLRKGETPCEKEFRPDIVVHLRRKNRRNLIVIEVKKNNKNKRCLFDEIKLRALTKPKNDGGKYRYKLGVFLYFPDGKPTLLPFLKGNKCHGCERVLQLDSVGNHVWTTASNNPR